MSYERARTEPKSRAYRLNAARLATKEAKNTLRPIAPQSQFFVAANPAFSGTLLRTRLFDINRDDVDFCWPRGEMNNNDPLQHTAGIVLDCDAYETGPRGMPRHVRFCSNGTHASQYWNSKTGTTARFAGMLITSKSESDVYGPGNGQLSAMRDTPGGAGSMIQLQLMGTQNLRNFSQGDCKIGDMLMLALQPVNGGMPPVIDATRPTAYRFGYLPVPATLKHKLLSDPTYLQTRIKQDPILAYMMAQAKNAKADNPSVQAVEWYMPHVRAWTIGLCVHGAKSGDVGAVLLRPH